MKPTKTAKPEPEKPTYQMTAEDKAAVRRVHARRDGLPKLPRATVKQEGAGVTIGLEHEDEAVGHTVLMDALGISGLGFFNGYLNQVVSVATTGKIANAFEIDAMLSAIAGVRPRDDMEAMLAAQMVATHNLAMTFVRRLNHVENIKQQDSAVNGLTKLTRTYAAQMAALKHYRTGGEQRVIVQRVDVREGGQAVVGVVNSDRGGWGPRTKARTSPCKASYRCTKRRDAVRHRSGAGSGASRQRCGAGGHAGCTEGLAPVPRPGRRTATIGPGSGRWNGWRCDGR